MRRAAWITLVALAVLGLALVLLASGFAAERWREQVSLGEHRRAAEELRFPDGALRRTTSAAPGDWKVPGEEGRTTARYPPERDAQALLLELAELLRADGHLVKETDDGRGPSHWLIGERAGGGSIACSSRPEDRAQPPFVHLGCAVRLPR